MENNNNPQVDQYGNPVGDGQQNNNPAGQNDSQPNLNDAKPPQDPRDAAYGYQRRKEQEAARAAAASQSNPEQEALERELRWLS